MDNNYVELMDLLTERKAQSFLSKVTNDIKLTTNIKQVVRDLSWIEKIEETIPYIDAIVRNPRKFIIQEEEIIPVEKTKKVTEESIKHLARHTNLIQDIDEKGDVKPLKLLNVFKEETTDLYENRFVYSLIVNVKTFLNNFIEGYIVLEKSKYVKDLNYSMGTKLPGEKISINVSVINEFNANAEEDDLAVAYETRINRINEIFSDFLSTQFIKSLNGVTPVRSPLRKTNVLLKDQNFVKSVELWEYIEKYDVTKATVINEITKEEETDNLVDNLNLAAYIQYDSVASNRNMKVDDEYKFTSAYIRKIIECYVSEYDLDEKKFKNLISKEFKRAKDIKEKIYINIRNDFKSNIIKHNERLENALKFLN